MHEGILSYENEVFQSVFDSRSSDIEDSPVNDRYTEGMHAVPPPMIGFYILSGLDKEIDESKFTYGPKQSKPSVSDARSSDFNSCESNSSEETLESMLEPVVNEPKVVSQPKVWSDASIIEEYKSDSDDDCVSTPSKEQEQPSFAFVNTAKHVKTPRETIKNQHTYSQSPKVDSRDCNGLMSQNLGLGYGFTMKACFVCGSFSHLIRDCDFHEKRMAKQAELNKRMVNTTKANSTNNVNTARHNFNSQAVSTNTARKVNIVRPNVNDVDMGLGYWLSMDLRNSYLCLLKFFNLTLRHCQKRRSYQSDGKLLEILTFIYNRHFKKDIRYNSSGSLETLLELHDVLYVVVRGEACFYGSFEPAGIKNLHHYL
ncbi:hypothetical protein Tco_1376262 [Tanacetum coccineum]